MVNNTDYMKWPLSSSLEWDAAIKKRAGSTRPLVHRPDCRGLLDVDGDLLRLRFLPLRQADGEHPVLVGRGDLARIYRVRQGEGPGEGAMAALDALEVLPLYVLAELPLALQREHAVLEGDVDVLTLQVGELRLQHHLVRVGLVNVDRRHPGTRKGLTVEIREHPVQPVDLHGCKLTSRFPANDCHCFLLCLSASGRPRKFAFEQYTNLISICQAYYLSYTYSYIFQLGLADV